MLACHGVGATDQVPEDMLGWRDAALISLLVGAGLRAKEVVNLTRGDYRPKTGTINVSGKNQRQAYFHRSSYDSLVSRLLDVIPGETENPLIPKLTSGRKVLKPIVDKISTKTVSEVLEARAVQAGVSRPLTPNDLRRSFIIHQLESGTDPSRISEGVGNFDIKSHKRLLEDVKRNDLKESNLKRTLREAPFLAALGGGDWRVFASTFVGALDVIDVPMYALLYSSWRAPLRSLKKQKEGHVYSIMLGDSVLYVGKSKTVCERMIEHTTIGNERGNHMLHRCLEKYPDDIFNWTVRIRPDVAISDYLSDAENYIIKKERPCFNCSVNPNPKSIPEKYRSIFPERDPNANPFINNPVIEAMKRIARTAAAIAEEEKAVKLENAGNKT